MLAEIVRRYDLHPYTEDTPPAVGKSGWWSEVLHVGLGLMWDHEDV